MVVDRNVKALMRIVKAWSSVHCQILDHYFEHFEFDKKLKEREKVILKVMRDKIKDIKSDDNADYMLELFNK